MKCIDLLIIIKEQSLSVHRDTLKNSSQTAISNDGDKDAISFIKKFLNQHILIINNNGFHYGIFMNSSPKENISVKHFSL